MCLGEKVFMFMFVFGKVGDRVNKVVALEDTIFFLKYIFAYNGVMD